MRRGLFLVLIVLTTLRGLASPAMAAVMALPQATPVLTAPHGIAHEEAPSAHGGQHHAGAPEHADHALPAEPRAACHAEAEPLLHPGANDAPHAACADCDICHTVVLTPPAVSVLPDAATAARLDLRSTRFASAAPALPTKPPIS